MPSFQHNQCITGQCIQSLRDVPGGPRSITKGAFGGRKYYYAPCGVEVDSIPACDAANPSASDFEYVGGGVITKACNDGVAGDQWILIQRQPGAMRVWLRLVDVSKDVTYASCNGGEGGVGSVA